MPDTPPTLELASAPFARFLGALGAKTPAPGGGAAAGAAGAVAAALGRMVVAYSIGRKSLEGHRAALEEAGGRLDRARDLFLMLAEEDAAAYAEFSALQKLPEGDAGRAAREPAAIEACVGAPRAMLAAGVDLLRLLESLCGITNPHLRSDLAVAAVLAEGAASSAAWNVRVNLPLVRDEGRRGSLASDTDRGVEEARERRGRVERACAGDA